jgi:hypothetical protein
LTSLAGDPECAHGVEDDIYRDALRAIAQGTDDAAAIAREALKAADVRFPRWYA